jgi:UDP-N-acetylglucosamine 1-carboxyvinyltransferase
MDKLLIKGGRRLSGRVEASTAKNAVLPIMAASLLTPEPCEIQNIPDLTDVRTMGEMLSQLGVRLEWSGRDLRIDASGPLKLKAPYEVVRRMRASYYVLGPLLGRFRKAQVALPGGCAIGPRPVDLHLKGMRKLGARIRVEHGYIQAQASSLIGDDVVLSGPKGPSVGATCNLLMAASLARGRTRIQGAAGEPEVVDLAGFLSQMGAKIRGAGTAVIEVDGVSALHGTRYSPIPDRIEAATLALAGVITHGEVEVDNCRPEDLSAVIEKLEEAGVSVSVSQGSIRVKQEGPIKPLELTTTPYPGFPTDLQAQFMVILSLAQGTSVIREEIFEARFLHALELNRMGAEIVIDEGTAIIHGVERLSGAPVMASDLRASAALVLAGLAAEGETVVQRIYHLDRGYEHLERKLSSLGAEIERIG